MLHLSYYLGIRWEYHRRKWLRKSFVLWGYLIWRLCCKGQERDHYLEELRLGLEKEKKENYRDILWRYNFQGRIELIGIGAQKGIVCFWKADQWPNLTLLKTCATSRNTLGQYFFSQKRMKLCRLPMDLLYCGIFCTKSKLDIRYYFLSFCDWS